MSRISGALLFLSLSVGIVLSGANSSPGNDGPVSPSASGFRGVVTWTDPDRNLVVLQRGSEAVALAMDSPVSFGEEIGLEGRMTALTTAFPDFPDHPAERNIRDSFEAPSNRGDYYLVRMRGLLRPPVTGQYTFWIASDDSSELWLSGNTDPRNAAMIASVGNGRWTEPRQWTRFPSQQSKEIWLTAGSSYYIEALMQETIGRDSLAVAWSGPAVERSVIPGQYLSPAETDEKQSAGRTNGILLEYWPNFFSADLSVLRYRDPAIVRVSPVRLLGRQKGTLPKPIEIKPGQILDPKENFRWVEVQGRLGFSGRPGGRLEMELVEGQERIRIAGKGDFPDAQLFPPNSVVRVRGVCEAERGPDDQLRARTVWIGASSNVVWLDMEENRSQTEVLPMYRLVPSNPELTSGQLVHVRGRAVGPEADGSWLFQGADTFSGFTSADGTNWDLLDAPVEIRMSNSVCVGLAVASHQPDRIVEARFDQVRGLSTNLTGTDIGFPPQAGGIECDGKTYVVRGSGEDIWSGSDQCHFAWDNFSGDGEWSAHLTTLNSDDVQAKVALMIRESLDNHSPWAAMVLMPGQRVGFQARRERSRNAAGLVAAKAVSWVKIARRQNTFRVRPLSSEQIRAGDTFELLGALAWENNVPLLEKARCRPVKGQTLSGGMNVAAVNSRPPGTDLVDVPIKDLREETEKVQLAGHSGRFRIRGVVTFSDRRMGEPLFIVQDSTGACAVRFRGDGLRDFFRVGQLVELTGVASLGNFPPEFVANGIAGFGSGTMPVPLRHPFVPPLGERQYGQWMEIEGVGRSIDANGQLVVLTPDGLLSVAGGDGSSNHFAGLVNSLLRVRGVYWGKPASLLLPTESFIEVEQPAPEHPFDVPTFLTSDVRALNASPQLVRRMKVTGVVTCCRDDFFVVQDASGGIRVQTVAPEIAVGNRVEVVGFPDRTGSDFLLSDALVRKTGAGVEPAPVRLSEHGAGEELPGGMLITLEAQLVEQHVARGIQSMDLQLGQRVVRATLPDKSGRIPMIAVGSRIRVKGVSQVETAEPLPGEAGVGKPRVTSLQLLLRQPGDLMVIERPPWWSWKHTAGTIGFFLVVIAGAFVWIRTLRRRVEEKADELRETMVKLQRETRISATLAERDRLAAEVHDSLEQGLSAIVMQMEAAAKLVDKPDEVRRFLTMAKNMAGFSRAEVQRAVWDMQSPLLENTDLTTALRRVAQEISAGDTPRVIVEISGTVFPLASTVEHHLLRMAQEAITNAVKHGNPKTISLALRYTPDAVTLTVHDDGAGFVPEAISTKGGHFGLQGMRGRASKIGAELTLESKPDGGATIRIIVPRTYQVTQGEDPRANGHP